MDPVEVILTVRPGQSSLDSCTFEERREIVKNWAVNRERIAAERRANLALLNNAYRELTLEQARKLADVGIKRYDVAPEKDRADRKRYLARLANFVSGALANEYAAILQRDLFGPDSMYRDADPTSRDALMKRATATVEPARNGVLCALAWIGDTAVQAKFAAWRAEPPPWRSSLYIPPEEYARQAGWELDASGHRRELHYQRCFELERVTRGSDEAFASPVRVLTPHEGTCAWCSERLVTLFDLDLRDARLAFIASDGERLRIALCPWCSYLTQVFTDIDLAGTSVWSDDNDLDAFDRARIPRTAISEELFPSPEYALGLGSKRRTPYETQSSEVCLHDSQIGGYPSWVQDAEYPMCPRCGTRMPFVGQLATEDIVENSEGITYAFACLPCGKATTVYQQT